MKKTIFAAVITIGSALSGCSTIESVGDFGAYETGIFISQERMNLAIDGSSSQKDISDLYGHPNRKDQVSEKELWYYSYNKIRTVGGNISESTVFEFNKKGTLLKHYKTNQSGKTGNALLDAAGL